MKGVWQIQIASEQFRRKFTAGKGNVVGLDPEIGGCDHIANRQHSNRQHTRTDDGALLGLNIE